MKQKRTGLYLGTNSVGVVTLQDRDVVSLVKLELSSMEDSNVESLNEDIR